MIIQIPKDSVFRPTVNLFTATFNNPTLGKYDFGVAANTLQDVMQVNHTNLFYIEGMNVSATVLETAYIENLSTVPKVQFFLKKNAQALFGGAYPIGKYLQPNEISAFFSGDQVGDTLQATVTGVLNQNANMIQYGSVTIVLALNIFEISDPKFIAEFKKITNNGPNQISDVQIPFGLERRI